MKHNADKETENCRRYRITNWRDNIATAECLALAEWVHVTSWDGLHVVTASVCEQRGVSVERNTFYENLPKTNTNKQNHTMQQTYNHTLR
jgi:hypothetical protein